MTREEAIKIMQLNKGRMNGSVQAALAFLLPELDAPQRTVLEWRTCKAGDQLGLRALIRYPAYAEIGYYAKADGDWVPMDEIEHQHEKICATCAYYNDRTRWDGYCEAGAEQVLVSADHVCANWEYYDTSNVEKAQASPKATPCCLNCVEKEKCSREDKRWGGPCEAHRMEGQELTEVEKSARRLNEEMMRRFRQEAEEEQKEANNG